MTPIILGFTMLASSLDIGSAWKGLLGGWVHIFTDELSELPFYQSSMGLDQPWANLWRMLFVFSGYILILLAGFLACAASRQKNIQIYLGLLIVVPLIVLAWIFRNEIPFRDAARALPLFMTVGIFYFFWRHVTQKDFRYLPGFGVCLFSLLLLAKMLFNTRFYHYGFALAMPATMIWIVMLTDWIPGYIHNRGFNPLGFKAAAIAVIGIIVCWHIGISARIYDNKSIAVGQDGDRFYADIRGKAVNEFVTWFSSNRNPSDSLVVLPEGIMLNYLTRTPNPTPVVNLMPPELIMFGEESILRALQQSPASFIALVHKDTSEYGARFFGMHYGTEIAKWIKENYDPVYLIGFPPLQDRRFGVGIVKYDHR
jgi:hypothetical protein